MNCADQVNNKMEKNTGASKPLYKKNHGAAYIDDALKLLTVLKKVK